MPASPPLSRALRLLALLLLLPLAALGAAAQAQEVAGPGGGAAAARLGVLPGWRQEDGRHVAALVLDMAPGWNTYWRVPGPAGIPPELDWSASRNLAALEARWPSPHVITKAGLKAYGYSGALIVPLVLTPERKEAPIELDLVFRFGLCREVCMPESARLRARLDPARREPDPRILAALEAGPASAAAAGVRAIDCALEPTRRGFRLRASVELPPQGAPEALVVELPSDSLWVRSQRSRREGRALIAELDVRHIGEEPLVLERRQMRLTVIGARRAVSAGSCAD